LKGKHIMKTTRTAQLTLTAIAAGLFFAVITGCQDFSLTTPITTPEESLRMKPKPQPGTDMIPLEGMLKVLGRRLNVFASIKGQVQYSLKSTPYRGVYRIDLSLATTAAITPVIADAEINTVWSVEGKSQDQLFVSEEGIALLEKYYPVQGRRDRMMLHLEFLLTSDGIGLSGMWLEAPEIRSAEAQTD
jgi:hypothetical protein